MEAGCNVSYEGWNILVDPIDRLIQQRVSESEKRALHHFAPLVQFTNTPLIIDDPTATEKPRT